MPNSLAHMGSHAAVAIVAVRLTGKPTLGRSFASKFFPLSYTARQRVSVGIMKPKVVKFAKPNNKRAGFNAFVRQRGAAGIDYKLYKR